MMALFWGVYKAMRKRQAGTVLYYVFFNKYRSHRALCAMGI